MIVSKQLRNYQVIFLDHATKVLKSMLSGDKKGERFLKEGVFQFVGERVTASLTLGGAGIFYCQSI